MRTAINLFISSLLVTVSFLGISQLHAVAQEDDVQGSTVSQEPQAASQPSTYTFVTPQGGSLSILARRAIQLYDQQRTDIDLTPAQAVYIEANIVQSLGPRLLEIGEHITIPKDLVSSFAEKSRALDTDMTAAWQGYAANADFDVTTVNPENSETPDTSPVPSDTQTQDQTQNTDDVLPEGSTQGTVTNNSAAESSSKNWVVLAGILAIGVAVYFLNPNKAPAPPAKVAKKTTRKTSTTKRKTKK